MEQDFEFTSATTKLVVPAGCFRPIAYTIVALAFAACGMGIATICTVAAFWVDEKVNA